MPLNIIANRIYRFILLVGILSLAACNIAKPPPAIEYQEAAVEPSAQVKSGPVNELHNRALDAIDGNEYQLAVNYLQRAIKIQPRNAWSWHYLAQTYWYQGQTSRCIDLIERSISYISDDAFLEKSNKNLRSKCETS